MGNIFKPARQLHVHAAAHKAVGANLNVLFKTQLPPRDQARLLPRGRVLASVSVKQRQISYPTKCCGTPQQSFTLGIQSCTWLGVRPLAPGPSGEGGRPRGQRAGVSVKYITPGRLYHPSMKKNISTPQAPLRSVRSRCLAAISQRLLLGCTSRR